MAITVSAVTTATAESVWEKMTDIERWPSLTPYVTAARRLDEGPLRLGSRARLKQPRMPEMTWEVTELSPRARFSWQARSPGVTTLGRHVLVPEGDGRVRVVLEIEHRGPLARPVSALTRRRTRRYMQAEAAGLTRTD
jgi:uncharacterized membrane protein